MIEKTYNPGDLLFQEGDSGEDAFLIKEGSVEILTDYSTTPKRMGVVGPGAVLGEMSLIEERPRSRTARAVDKVAVTRMTRSDFHKLLLSDPERCTSYLRSLFERLRNLEGQLQQLTAQGHEIGMKEAAKLQVKLFPLSRRTAQMLSESGVVISSFPWRLGRASEADEQEAFDLNDFWILDEQPFQVSRNHMLFDCLANGQIVIRDRGSKLGTVVNETVLGGRSHNRKEVELDSGDNVVILGTWKSPWRFRVRVEELN
ncbi:MAG: cyclic nucleotide-binding domain-containing protein [Gemmataceae bacterium]